MHSFLIDEISDDQTGDATRAMGESFVRAMSSDWDDDSLFSKIAKESVFLFDICF